MDYRLCFQKSVRHMNCLRKRPKPLRCSRIDVTPDLVAIYEIKSHTFRGSFYHPCIDLVSGRMDCHCMDFETRHVPAARAASVEIGLSTPQYWCKHLAAVVVDVLRRDEARVSLNHARIESLSAESGFALAPAADRRW